MLISSLEPLQPICTLLPWSRYMFIRVPFQLPAYHIPTMSYSSCETQIHVRVAYIYLILRFIC